MVDLKTITQIEGLGTVVEAYGTFYDCLLTLHEAGARVSSIRDEAISRIKTIGQEDIGKHVGTFVSIGCLYARGRKPLLVGNSRLLVQDLALKVKDFYEVQKEGTKPRFFSTESTKEYDETYELVKKDMQKDWEDKKAIDLPTVDTHQITQYGLRFLFRDLPKLFRHFNKETPLKFFPVPRDIVERYDGTILTQLFIKSFHQSSELRGDKRPIGKHYVRGIL